MYTKILLKSFQPCKRVQSRTQAQKIYIYKLFLWCKKQINVFTVGRLTNTRLFQAACCFLEGLTVVSFFESNSCIGWNPTWDNTLYDQKIVVLSLGVRCVCFLNPRYRLIRSAIVVFFVCRNNFKQEKRSNSPNKC